MCAKELGGRSLTRTLTPTLTITPTLTRPVPPTEREGVSSSSVSMGVVLIAKEWVSIVGYDNGRDS